MDADTCDFTPAGAKSWRCARVLRLPFLSSRTACAYRHLLAWRRLTWAWRRRRQDGGRKVLEWRRRSCSTCCSSFRGYCTGSIAYSQYRHGQGKKHPVMISYISHTFESKRFHSITCPRGGDRTFRSEIWEKVEEPHPITALRFHPKGTLLFASTSNGHVLAFNVRTKMVKFSFRVMIPVSWYLDDSST